VINLKKKLYVNLWDGIEFRYPPFNRKAPKYVTTGMVEYEEKDNEVTVHIETEKIEDGDCDL
jgi:hypothetical protein